MNRVVIASEDGYTYEADARYSQFVVNTFNLQDSKPLSSPAAGMTQEGEEMLLEHKRPKMLQSICARANFLSIDRSDIQHTAKSLCRAMSKPTEGYWSRLERLGIYLVNRPRLQYVPVYVDANWASHSKVRKSTSDDVIPPRRPLHKYLVADAILHCIRRPSRSCTESVKRRRGRFASARFCRIWGISLRTSS